MAGQQFCRSTFCCLIWAGPWESYSSGGEHSHFTRRQFLGNLLTRRSILIRGGFQRGLLYD
jgi:hypothetical protein